MEKSLFERMGGKYTKVGDYLLPNLVLPEKENKPIGIWGHRYLQHIKQHHQYLYFSLLANGELNSHLAEIDKQATEMYLRLVKQMAEQEGVTEQLKSEKQMEWVSGMNNIASRAREIVNAEIIYIYEQ